MVGFAVTSLIFPSNRLGLAQRMILSLALGAGTTGLLLFWVSLMGIAASRMALGIIGCAAIAGLLLSMRAKRLAPKTRLPAFTPADKLLLLPVGTAAAAMLVMTIGAVSSPLTEWDGFSIWGFKAKVLCHFPLWPKPDCFHDLTLNFTHLNYPLMVPFLAAGAYGAAGGVHEPCAKMVSACLDLLIVPMLYLGLRWKLARLPAACLSAICALLPVLDRYAGTLCADAALAMFYTGSLLFLAKWTSAQKREDLVLLTLFSAFAFFTKNEGMFLALANGVVLCVLAVRRRAWFAPLIFLAGVVVLNLAWLLWRADLPRTDEDYASKLGFSAIAANGSRLSLIFPAVAQKLADWRFGGFVLVLAGSLAGIGWRAFCRPYIIAAWAALALHLLGYVLAYMVTPWNVELLLRLTLDRVLLHVMPAMILLAGWHWSELRPTEDEEKTPDAPAQITGTV